MQRRPSLLEELDRTTSFYVEDEDFLVVHGLKPGFHPSQTGARILTKIRTWDGLGEELKDMDNPAWHDFYQDEKVVIYGHWAYQGLHLTKNTIGLDSGCVYGNQLSGVMLPEREIIQVQAKEFIFPILKPDYFFWHFIFLPSAKSLKSSYFWVFQSIRRQ